MPDIACSTEPLPPEGVQLMPLQLNVSYPLQDMEYSNEEIISDLWQIIDPEATEEQKEKSPPSSPPILFLQQEERLCENLQSYQEKSDYVPIVSTVEQPVPTATGKPPRQQPLHDRRLWEQLVKSQPPHMQDILVNKSVRDLRGVNIIMNRMYATVAARSAQEKWRDLCADACKTWESVFPTKQFADFNCTLYMLRNDGVKNKKLWVYMNLLFAAHPNSGPPCIRLDFVPPPCNKKNYSMIMMKKKDYRTQEELRLCSELEAYLDTTFYGIQEFLVLNVEEFDKRFAFETNCMRDSVGNMKVITNQRVSSMFRSIGMQPANSPRSRDATGKCIWSHLFTGKAPFVYNAHTEAVVSERLVKYRVGKM